MAVTTSLSRNVRKIGVAIRTFAATEGIVRDHLAITGILHRKIERIFISVGTDKPINWREWYPKIQEAVRNELGFMPSSSHLGITVQQIENLDAFYDDMIVEDDDIDLTDML